MRTAGVALSATCLLLSFVLSTCKAQGVHKLATLQGPAHVQRVSACGSSDLAAAIGEHGTVFVWRISTGALLTRRPPQEELRSAACAPDGKTLALGTKDGSVLITDLSGKVLRTLKVAENAVVSTTFSPDGTLLAVNATPSPIELWDPVRGTRVARLKTSFSGSEDLDFSPDSQLIATADDDTAIRIYSRDGTLKASYTDLLLEPFGISFIHDGKQVAVGGADNLLTILDATDARMVRQLPKHADPIFAVTALPGDSLLTLDIDAATLKKFTVARYDLTSGTQHILSVQGEHLVGDGKTANHAPLLFTAESDATITAWAVDNPH